MFVKRIASLGFAVSALALATACSGGYNVIAPSPGPSASGNAGVVFLVTAPMASSSNNLRKPNISAPAGTQSVSVTLQSVNGSAVTNGASATQNISASASGCTTGNQEYICQFTVNAQSGNDIFLVKTFSQSNAQGAATGAGAVSVNASSGQNTIAPTVLNGTIASIALSVSSSVVPAANGSIPLTIVAKDASGNTIIGQYSNAITLTDSDPSGKTSLSATSVPDSTTASGIRIQFSGGAMTHPATISASAANVAASAVTPATFSVDNSYPTVDGSTNTFNLAIAQAENAPGQTVNTPAPMPTTSVTQAYKTGTTFNNLSNLIEISTTYSSLVYSNVSAPLAAPPESGLDYYQWSNEAGIAKLQHVGFNRQVSNGPFSGTDVETCAAPYQTAWSLPLSQSWSVYNGTGACNENVSVSGFFNFSDEYADNADGSYSETYSGSGFLMPPTTGTASANADGSTAFTSNSANNSYVINVSAPNFSSPTLTAQVQAFSTALPSPLPSVTPTTVPNWYVSAGLTKLPNPLRSDVFTPKGPVASLDASCQVTAGIIPSGASISEVDEAYQYVNPLQGYNNTTTKWYLVNGLGVVCSVQQSSIYQTYVATQLNPAQDTVTTMTQTMSLTTSSLTQAMARTRSFALAYPAAQSGIISAGQHPSIWQSSALYRRLRQAHR